ncbi:MAG TPA: hypothetical protein VFV99_21670 [Kofleriaceae bacterium]|nr:hypothetical protein [Kofleriaceae bacterium]
MGKRVSNDATQELSASQLVPDAKPPPKPSGNLPGVAPYGGPKNDASMWMQAPVSADDFVSAPRKRPSAPSSGRGLVIGVIVVLFVLMVGAGAWYAFLRESPKQSSAFDTKPAPSTPNTSVVPAPPDAALAVAAPDAAAVAATPDAGTADQALAADAVSGAGPVQKKATKRATTKKKVTKKKTATAPKRRK